jgi:carbonic anhydrase/acetyltransferase-like protein (isoleucine patch superfamily)
MILPFRGVTPVVDATAWIVAEATVIGDVVIGPASSVWFYTVIRGDVFPIRIGARTNVQDHVTVHVTGGRYPTTIGDDVTVGHRAVLHGCTIGDRTLVGIGAIVLDGAEIGADCLIGAGALVTPRMVVPSGHLVLGSPAKITRALREDERAHITQSAANYARYAAEYRAAK